MAKAAILETSKANSFSFGRLQSDVTMKMKTPSELRGEQLKRRIGRSLRVNEVYPVKKSSERCRVLDGKEKAKVLLTSDILSDVINPSAACSLPGKENSSLFCDKAGKLDNHECSNPFAKDIDNQGPLKNEKCNQHNVAELHLGKRKPDYGNFDMEALKGLTTLHIPVSSADCSGVPVDLPSKASNFYYELHIPGLRPPLDFTLKTSLRLVSSTSVKWCHMLSANPAPIDSSRFTSQSFCNLDKSLCSKSESNANTETLYSKALHSWIYPQSSLPPSIISAMASSSARGEMDFLQKRQQDWEDSFRNLYYLLRANMCNIFYVYTSQFIVMFVGGNFFGKKKRSCNAYVSQSTRGLRSLLRKSAICFSMPLCRAGVEQATDDDLIELSEIEKHNLGQTFHLDPLSDVDNSPPSLLAITGNENVHSLYNFLFNYRFFLSSLTVVDVPVLYSPIPFLNASLCVPEVRCKEMKKTDTAALTSFNKSGGEDSEGISSSGMCYSIEIKDAVLPPWVICGICVALGSGVRDFESRFTNEPMSIGLNVALDSVLNKSNKSSTECVDAFGVPEAIMVPSLRSALIQKLKFMKGSYIAGLLTM